MEINDRQRQQLSTCMPSCRNIAYPSLGLVEEIGEYIQKLIYMVTWNPDFPKSEKDHLLMLLQGIASNAYAVGRLNKAIRHGDYPQPFAFKFPPAAIAPVGHTPDCSAPVMRPCSEGFHPEAPTSPVPFRGIHAEAQSAAHTPSSSEEDYNPFFQDRIEALQKELGDIDWMVNASHFYTVFPDGTDPTTDNQPMTAQLMHDQNYNKLAERRLHNTIDGQGDTSRSTI